MSVIQRAGKRFILVAALTTAVFFLLARPASRAAPQVPINIKISGDMQPNGGVQSGGSVISPDFSHVAFVADKVTDNAFELFLGSTTGEFAPFRLSAVLGMGQMVRSPAFTPDGEIVVYIAAEDDSEVDELFAADIAGSPGYRLSGPMTLGGNVLAFEIASNSDWVVYLADQEADGKFELFSVGITGGTPIKLNGPLTPGGNIGVFGFRITPDSSRVLYRADQDADEVYELYSVPINGGPVTKLNGPLVDGGDVYNYLISADSSRVVYFADQDTDDVFELYSVPVTGGQVTRLNGSLVPGGRVFTAQISADSSRVVYIADQETDDVNEVFSVAITGGAVTKLNGPVVSGGQIGEIYISPDSSRVVYMGDQQTDGVFELYSVPITGGPATKLNGPLTPGGGVYGESAIISPDSQRVVYLADQDTDEVVEIYSVPITGGTPSS
jgi:Tol biopolymer transport system component